MQFFFSQIDEESHLLTNKTVIADLSTNAGVLVQRVLCANAEFGCIGSRGPC